MYFQNESFNHSLNDAVNKVDQFYHLNLLFYMPAQVFRDNYVGMNFTKQTETLRKADAEFHYSNWSSTIGSE